MSTPEASLRDMLYDKSYTCPVCQCAFKSKAIRLSVNQALSSDIDLYPRYSHVNPLLYDAILCPSCGYCALTKNFDRILPTQAQWIKDIITPNYQKRYFGRFMSLKDAVVKHQLALVCSITKKSKAGEQGYIALHIAWLYRDLGDKEHETIYLKRAVEALMHALETEHFPLFNLEFTTASYIVAAIHYQLGNTDIAKRYLGEVVISASGSLKDRALDLKALLPKN